MLSDSFRGPLPGARREPQDVYMHWLRKRLTVRAETRVRTVRGRNAVLYPAELRALSLVKYRTGASTAALRAGTWCG